MFRKSQIYLFKFSPFLDSDGIIRVRTRIQMSRLSYEEKNPIVVPKSWFAVLLVRHQHALLKHSGIETVINSIRNSYWVFGLRVICKGVKRQCVACQRLDAQACNQPVAPLPELRTAEAPPFSVIGLDYAGPLYCIDFPKRKLYILLFTCAVTRAVHLELTDSLGVKDFVMALKRFSSRRGSPRYIYSDNAATFRSFRDKILSSLCIEAPEWKFIVPRSPWWGGWWERLVRSVKSSIKRSVGQSSLTKVELETTLVEVEACINSRPLTFVSDDSNFVEPLTPSHFLLGRLPSACTTVMPLDKSLNREALVLREQVRVKMLNKFWEVWRQEYLRGLPVVVHKFFKRGDLEVGSIVMIMEDGVPRLRWELGQVTKLFKGRDGLVRSARIKTQKGERVRPIQRLCKLEVQPEEAEVLPSLPPEAPDYPSLDIPRPQSPEIQSLDPSENQVTDPPVDQNLNPPEPAQTSRIGRVIRPRKILDL